MFQYTILLVIIFMFESVIGLLSYGYQEQIDTDLQDSLMDIFINTYSLDMENTQAVDNIQTKVVLGLWKNLIYSAARLVE